MSAIAVVRDAQALEALAPEWHELPGPGIDPLLSHAWFAAAAAALHSDDRLCVLTLRREGRLAAVAPLVEVTRGGARHLEFIGSRGLYEPSGLLHRDAETLRELCVAVIGLRLPAALLRMTASGPGQNALRAASRRRALLVPVASPPCILADLRPGWQAYLATRDRHVLSEIARRKRRLAALGAVEFEMRAPAAASADAAIAEAVDVEADGWKGRSRSAMRHNSRIHAFVRDVAGRFAAQGALRVAFLRCAGVAVAMRIMIEWNDRLWAVKTGYRESARRYSPGMLITHDVLELACSRGLAAFEFLGSGDALQPAWGTGTRSLQSAVCYPYSLRGAWTLVVDAVSSMARRRQQDRRSAREQRS